MLAEYMRVSKAYDPKPFVMGEYYNAPQYTKISKTPVADLEAAFRQSGFEGKARRRRGL